MSVAPFTDLAYASVQIAMSQLGVHEQGGNNRGPEVDEYIKFIGLNPPEPWCSAFLCWCIDKAAKQIGITPDFKYGASVYKLWTLNQDLVIPAPTPNCLALRDEGLSAGHRVGHVLFVDSINDDGSLHCVSGNTNAAGSREGNCVAINDRPLSQFSAGYGFLRIG